MLSHHCLVHPCTNAVGRALQVRCLAVCKAWQRCLDLRALPVELCKVTASSPQEWPPLARWICQTQPCIRVLRITLDKEIRFGSLAVSAALAAVLSVGPREVSGRESFCSLVIQCEVACFVLCHERTQQAVCHFSCRCSKSYLSQGAPVCWSTWCGQYHAV